MRELELEPGRTFKMITLASKPPLFGKSGITECLGDETFYGNGQVIFIFKATLT